MRMHHYKDGELIFGVSTPLWDYIGGTMRHRESSQPRHHLVIAVSKSHRIPMALLL